MCMNNVMFLSDERLGLIVGTSSCTVPNSCVSYFVLSLKYRYIYLLYICM